MIESWQDGQLANTSHMLEFHTQAEAEKASAALKSALTVINHGTGISRSVTIVNLF
jgi:hypothetical protein